MATLVRNLLTSFIAAGWRVPQPRATFAFCAVMQPKINLKGLPQRLKFLRRKLTLIIAMYVL